MLRVAFGNPRRWCLPLLLTAALAASPALAADQSGRITIGRLARTYSLHVPDKASPPGGFPVVLALHGGGGQGESMRRLTGLDNLADRRNFIVVYPDGLDKHWNDGRSTIKNPQDDVGFVRALLRRLGRDYRLDSEQVFAAGISNGALFAERLGCEMAGTIKAIAAVAGALPADLAPRCRPAARVRVLQISGDADPIMPFAGGKVADFGGRGEGGSVLSIAATADFWARRNGCGAPGKAVDLRPRVLLDRTRVTYTAYRSCPAGGDVAVYRVQGGGHAWPGGGQYAPAFIVGKATRQIDASEAIVDFFLGD